MIGLLSIPTWIVHLSSVIEWSLAMIFFYTIGKRMNNIWFKRMPLVMIPYMLSGFCALIYHVTEDTWIGLNEMQSYLTFLGSCCFAVWAFLFLRSVTATAKSKGVDRG